MVTSNLDRNGPAEAGRNEPDCDGDALDTDVVAADPGAQQDDARSHSCASSSCEEQNSLSSSSEDSVRLWQDSEDVGTRLERAKSIVADLGPGLSYMTRVEAQAAQPFTARSQQHQSVRVRRASIGAALMHEGFENLESNTKKCERSVAKHGSRSLDQSEISGNNGAGKSFVDASTALAEKLKQTLKERCESGEMEKTDPCLYDAAEAGATAQYPEPRHRTVSDDLKAQQAALAHRRSSIVGLTKTVEGGLAGEALEDRGLSQNPETTLGALSRSWSKSSSASSKASSVVSVSGLVDLPTQPSAATMRRSSQLQFACPSQTIIVFDFDDTLFPTTWLTEDAGLDWRFPLDHQVFCVSLLIFLMIRLYDVL